MMTGVIVLIAYLFGVAQMMLIHYYINYKDERPDLRRPPS